MSTAGEAVYEGVLTRGDVSPRAMESMVNVVLLGKGKDDSSTDDSSSSDSSRNDPKSKQIAGDPFSMMAKGEFVPPRHNPQVWASAMEQSTRLGRCIRTYARNTVGLGWFIEPINKINPETPKEVRKKVEKQTIKLQKMFDRPNPLMPTTQLFFMSKVDEESTGNGYLEIVRDNAGKINGIFHVPSVSMRIRVREGDNKEQMIGGFVQIRGNEKRYFKEFGDTKVMIAESGDYYRGNKPLPMNQRATEILHFKLYSPTSTWYGAPRYLSAAPAISGNRLAALRNVNFFENDAVPRMALMVSGGTLTPESVQSIEDFFKAKVQGVPKAHSVCVIQAEQRQVGFQQQGRGPRLDLKPLTVGVTEDASFETYRKSNDEEIREAFGLAPVFFTTTDVNKASAQVSREVSNEQELEPDRLEKEYIINQTVVADVLGEEPLVRFRFERMKLTDPLDTARMDQTYAGLGALTPNELRSSIGKPPYPKDYKFADKPMQVAMAELSMQLAEAIIGEFKSQIAHQTAQAKAQQEAAGMGGMVGGAEGGGEEPPPEEGAPEESGIEEWSDDASTDESSPITVDSEESEETDSSVKRIHEALGIGKDGSAKDLPVEALLGVATELMRDARNMGVKESLLSLTKEE
jgi:PBSX family phage portal protein